MKSSISFVKITCTPLLIFTAFFMISCVTPKVEDETRRTLSEERRQTLERKHEYFAQWAAQLNSHSGCERVDWHTLDSLQKALGNCRELQDRVGESQVLSVLGSAYFDRKDYRSAIEVFQQRMLIAASPPVQADSWIALGESYLAGGDHARAIDAYTQASQIASADVAPESPQMQILRGLSWTYFDLQDYHQAIMVLEHALDKLEDRGEMYSSSEGARIYAYLGLAYYRLGNLVTAEHYLRAAVYAPLSNLRLPWALPPEHVQQIKRLGIALPSANEQQDTVEWHYLLANALVGDDACPLLHEILAAMGQIARGLVAAEQYDASRLGGQGSGTCFRSPARGDLLHECRRSQ